MTNINGDIYKMTDVKRMTAKQDIEIVFPFIIRLPFKSLAY